MPVGPAEGTRTSRPLRTGRSFVLVLDEPRYRQLRWDAPEHEGGERRLLLDGLRLHGELVAEVEGDDGTGWRALARVPLTVSADRSSAEGRWTPPAAPPGRAGVLLEAHWERAAAAPGDEVGLRVRAQGLAEYCPIWVEREEPDGSWRAVALMGGQLGADEALGSFTVPGHPGAPPQQQGALLEVAHEGAPAAPGALAGVRASAAGLEGAWLSVVLEEEHGGGFRAVGSTACKVENGRVRALLPLPASAAPPPAGGGLLLEAALEDPGALAPGCAGVRVRASGLDGASLTVELEQEQAGGFRAIGSARCTVEGGRASAQLPLRGPAAAGTSSPQR